jgi:hypothetical protein
VPLLGGRRFASAPVSARRPRRVGQPIFFAYPPLLEERDGECGALEQRVADLTSRDASGLLTVRPLYGSTSSRPGGAVFAKDHYPLLPTAMGCTVAFWRTVLDPTIVTAAAKPASPQPAEPGPVGNGLDPIIARDITPNGDPISPATVFTLPMDAVAVRVDYPGKPVAARFEVRQGKAVLSPCAAERNTPGIPGASLM